MPVIEMRFHSYRYFPYERRLAKLEARRLLGAEPEEADGVLRVRTQSSVDPRTLQRLTYFGEVTVANGAKVVPQQSRIEASAGKPTRAGGLSRQQTRYSAHGLHEYRGKFNPQIVRAVMNLIGLHDRARIWDPFCGSGTVLLEARHQGYDALGVDLNPLAVAITNAKIAAVSVGSRSLQEATCMIAERTRSQTEWMTGTAPDRRAIESVLGMEWLQTFACSEYLERWFPLPVLAQFRIILDAIDEMAPSPLRPVFRIVLSDIVREVSWQDPGDLRIRRRKDPAPNYPVAEKFIAAVHAKVGAVTAAREHLAGREGWQQAVRGDSSDLATLNGAAGDFLHSGIDCVISSPPYATALPYIDTQRLSLALLGMATVREIRDLDAALIGSREVSTQERRDFEYAIEHNRADLPEAAWGICKTLLDAYDPDGDGFRRRNTPAVVYRYFAGMTRAMSLTAQCLKPGGSLAFVAGPNRTSLGGTEFVIDTPALLTAIGEHVGLSFSELHDLESYSRYDVHSRNSIRTEQLLVMQRP